VAALERLPFATVLRGILRWWAAWVYQSLAAAVGSSYVGRLEPVVQVRVDGMWIETWETSVVCC